jgi:uncharacterized protein YcfJ
MLKRTIVIGLLVVGGFVLNGCTTDQYGNKHVNKTVAGAGIGAVGGGLLGSAVGGTNGAIIGAGAGAVGGGLIGHQMQNQ